MDSAVESTTSQNITVRCRRSPSPGEPLGAGADGTWLVSGVPQLKQKRCPSLLILAH